MRVFIIDDYDTNLFLLEKIIARVDETVSVETFLDPVKAVERCSQQMPDMVLVDYMMPGMDGHEVIERIRKMPDAANVPIVMITAIDEHDVRQKALKLGATDFIAKPIEPQETKARLTNLLALRRSHLKLKDRNKWLVDEVREAIKAIADREEELIVKLSRAAEFRDPETGAHISRMAHYSWLTAVQLGVDSDICDLILRAAPMHDVGKLGTPDGILLKPARLDPVELDVMRRHSVIGYSILEGSSSKLIMLAADIALYHHEKFDGTGYPKGLKGDAIPLAARIVAVADVFDALTSERPYKQAWDLERARAFLIEHSGTHFDPLCVDAFLAVWDDVLQIRERYADVLCDDLE